MPHTVYKFVYLQLFNVKYKFVHLHLLDVKFLFSKKHIFLKQRKRLLMDMHPQFRILNSPWKMMTCYLRDTDTFLRYRTLCASILKFRFLTKSIKLTRFILLEVPGVPQPWGTSVQTILIGTTQKSMENKRSY